MARGVNEGEKVAAAPCCAASRQEGRKGCATHPPTGEMTERVCGFVVDRISDD